MENTSLSLIPLNTRSTFEGYVERVSYFNAETGQCLLEIKETDRDLVFSISECLPWVYPGLKIKGTLGAYDKESAIWKAQNIVLSWPDQRKALKKFFHAEILPGIGPRLSKILAEAFPSDFFNVLEKSPEDLLNVSGIGKKKKDQILKSWIHFKSKNELLSFLFDQQLPLEWATSLWTLYDEQSLEKLLKFPYHVGSHLHFSFELIDNLALQRGAALDSIERLRFGFKHVLWSFYKQGHCAYPEDLVFREAQILLEASRDQLEEILEIEILENQVVTETIAGVPCLYFKEVWDTERDVARRLSEFQFKEPSWGWFNFQKVLTWAQNILNIQLAALQQEAIKTALTSSLTVITGGPGTGKTTLIRSLVTILQTQHLRFVLCSPTGRAAQRLSEATGQPAQTIHRLLKLNSLNGKFFYNEDNPMDVDLVLVDEASMVDLQLFSDLLKALPRHCAIILVGDADQIPSVGAGNILQSIISSSLFKVVRLTDIFRQRENSQIKKNALRINAGLMPLNEEARDFQYIPVQNTYEAKLQMNHLLAKVIPEKYGIKNPSDVQVLVPLNQGILGAQKLNQEIQAQLGKEKHLPSSPLGFGQNFQLGDKVMVLKNDYKKDIFNGDIGFIEKIDQERQFFEINFSGRSVIFEFSKMDRLTLAYAISIHKAQGSEYRAVIVILTDEHLSLAQRHLVYTAVTRGKENVFLIAQPTALSKALQDVERRWEKLTELLCPSALDKLSERNLNP